MRKPLQILVLTLITATSSADNSGVGSVPAGAVTHARLQAAKEDLANWMLHGRTYEDQRYSPAKQITQANANRLGLAWHRDIDSPDGLNAAPIVVDGTIYISAPLSKVYAIDAQSGEIKWSYDPKVNLDTTLVGSYASRVNRGVAVWDGKVIVATGDCRLIALDAATGRQVWSVVGCDVKKSYYKNAAPRVGGGLVFTGSGGSEFGARGFVDAFRVDTGERVWRFYTVPNPDGNQETDALKMAAKTWTGDPKKIEGGTVWDAMTYDPEMDALYFGTAGAVPMPHKERSPKGGDNLFLESIVAIRASTGQYLWHYQTTPEDNYDFNATFHMILADLNIKGRVHKVLMTAPKNGYFYTLDRTNGKLLSIGPFARATWASKIDPQTGRPTWNPAVLPENLQPGKCFTMYPGGWGAHNWHAMSYSPVEKLVYLPVANLGRTTCKGADGKVSSEEIMVRDDQAADKGDLVAWDPVAAKARWRLPRATPYNGGTMVTGGGVVFEGTGNGLFQAVAADTGKLLWSYKVGSSIHGAPVSVVLGDEQYVFVVAGESTLMSTYLPALTGTPDAQGPARVLAFKLGAATQLQSANNVVRPVPKPPSLTFTDAQVKEGKELFHDQGCAYCHGLEVDNSQPSSIKDLRYLPEERHALWHGIVMGGMLREKGMLPFPVSMEQSDALHAYVVSKQRELYEKSRASTAPAPKSP